MKISNYNKFNNYRPISLNGLYECNKDVLNNLEYNIKNIIDIEAPITLNILKQRLRGALNVKKFTYYRCFKRL